ncbi:MAG: TolC family protein, partial [Pirellulaceae bacterium]
MNRSSVSNNTSRIVVYASIAALIGGSAGCSSGYSLSKRVAMHNQASSGIGATSVVEPAPTRQVHEADLRSGEPTQTARLVSGATGGPTKIRSASFQRQIDPPTIQDVQIPPPTVEIEASDELSLSVSPDADPKASLTGNPAPGTAEIVAAENVDLPGTAARAPALFDVAVSIHNTFPLLEAALQQNVIAAGDQLAAWGAFDTKLKGLSESGPLGFYETYRNSFGINQPLYGGGEVFGGYRVGRGDFQPWYQERETNAGGEFKAGIRVPLARNREIDARRAELWRTSYERQRVVPEIQAKLIKFVRDGSIIYWDWVAAGLKVRISERALKLAQRRNDAIATYVEIGRLEPPEKTDNDRSIASREAKLADLRRKLQQTAIKLSLFYRTLDGQPLVLDDETAGVFPVPALPAQPQLLQDLATAVEVRPELADIDAQLRQVRVDIAEAQNNLQPLLDAQIVGSEDMGAPTSSKRDKSQFELEAAFIFEMPVQFRKAFGSRQKALGKFQKISAERRFFVDKIQAEVRAAFAALVNAYEQLERAGESRALAEELAENERKLFLLERSDLFQIALREQIAVEAAEAEVDALLTYYIAKA